MKNKQQCFQQEFSSIQLSQSAGFYYLDNQEIQKLNISYNLMKNFLERVTDTPSYQVTQILERYSGKIVRLELISKNVMKYLDKRIQKMLKSKKLKKNWSIQDLQILYWTFCNYCKLNNIKSVEEASFQDWNSISALIPGASADNCMFKILSLKKIRLSNQKWTQLENQLLLQIVMKKVKKNWRQISQQLYKKNQNPKKVFRCAKQCKEHWVCYVNPQLKKGSWSQQQDISLLKFILNNKRNKKWSHLAKVFGGRTQNSLKNRYALIIQRLKLSKSEENQLKLIEEFIKSIQKNDQQRKSTVLQNKYKTKQIPIKYSNESYSQKHKQRTIHNQNSQESKLIQANVKQNQEQNLERQGQQNKSGFQFVYLPINIVSQFQPSAPAHMFFNYPCYVAENNFMGQSGLISGLTMDNPLILYQMPNYLYTQPNQQQIQKMVASNLNPSQNNSINHNKLKRQYNTLQQNTVVYNQSLPSNQF